MIGLGGCWRNLCGTMGLIDISGLLSPRLLSEVAVDISIHSSLRTTIY